MIAVDTNVLLRLIMADDARQFEAAKTLLSDNEIYVSLTVAMETEWVLRSRYRVDRDGIANALTGLFALAAITVERRAAVEWALRRYAIGGDFADLIHLAAVPEDVEAFATFDRGVGRAAGADASIAILELATA